MIQRKQSLFLLMAAISTAWLTIGSMAEYVNAEMSYVLKYLGIYPVTATVPVLGTYPLAISIIASTLLSVTTIFLFKKRQFQIRLCGVNLALIAGIIVFIFYFGRVGHKSLNAMVVYNWSSVLPFMALVMIVLAMISISKDEALVRSINRLR
ncbi:MAG: DUF4293 domain-containing protein [Breznakibacter sp.]